MKYEGAELNLFEDDLKKPDGKILKEEEITNSLCILYFNILTELQRQKRPPIEEFFIKEFKDKHRIELSLEEFVELKDYAEYSYSDRVISNISTGFATGNLTKLTDY